LEPADTSAKRCVRIISVIAFGCGPDSVMIEMVQRYARQASKPFMNLVIDEHTAEGGLATRVEAFVDMLKHKHKPKPARPHHNVPMI